MVEDTLRALGDLAAFHRARWGGKVVGITGSVGKTTTKELCRAGLEATGACVLATAGNLNNRIGVPMTLFGLSAAHSVAVIEMGTSEPGEIERLAAIAKPDVGVVLQVAEAHTAGLPSLDSVADEKTALFRALGPSHVAIANADDARIMGRVPAAGPHVLTFGAAEAADFRLIASTLEERGTRLDVRMPDGQTLSLTLRLFGEAAAIDATAALAVAAALDVPSGEFALGLSRVGPSPGRIEPKDGRGEVLVLDDTYNANPRSMRAALLTAAEVRAIRGGRLIVALGDMKELGNISTEAHRDIGRLVAEIAPAAFIAVGAEMSAAAEEATRAGIEVRRAADSTEAARVALALVRAHD
ncbi:MAG: UDP-N-acetylmuramoyl-tripeptide--D-alanyl-D-alanine ligase, partial [Polyangiaceae bacterium]|nr:UDP-N-acetylmuramoyl-tripeptide--D-alanyl-D-alanine ligase [Polyangiaceae bacterium]